MNKEKLSIHPDTSGEIQKKSLNPNEVKGIIDVVFANLSPEEKSSIGNVILDSKLKLSLNNIKLILEQAKKGSEKTKTSPLNFVRKFLDFQKKQMKQKLDIQKFPTLSAKAQDNKKENQVKEKENQVKEKENQVKRKKININERLTQQIKQTKEAYQKLNPTLRQHTSDELNSKVSTLSPVVRAKLKKNNIAPAEYANFLLSREKIRWDTKKPENEAFLKSLKNMERSLGIEEQTQWGYPLSYEPKAKVFDQNPDLAEFAKNDQAFSRLENVEIFPKGDERDQKLIEKFGDRGLKELAGKVASLDARQKQGEALSIQEKEMITAYQQQLEALKAQMQSRLTNYLKASITQAPVVALMRYLGQESLGGKKLSDLLSHQDKPFATLAQETTLTGKAEPILQLKGMIEGKPLTFYYNLADPTASLECDDNLHYDPFSHQLSLWVQGKGNRTKLNLQMPTTKELSQRLEEALTPEKVKDIIDQASDLQDYQEKIWLLASDQLEDSFSADETIHSRLARHTEKNLAIQELQAQLVPPEITHQLMKDGLINQHRPTQNVFRLLDRTSEESTDAELQSFRIAIKKLDSFLKSPNLSQKIMEIQDPILRNVLTKLSDANLKKSDFQVRSTAMLDFFNLFTRQNLTDNSVNPQAPDYKMNLSDFSRFISFLDRPDQMITDPKHLEQFSPAFREKYQLQESAQQGGLSHLEDEIAAVYEEEPSYAYA